MHAPYPKYPNLAMAAAILWLALGAAGIVGGFVKILISENPQLSPEDGGVAVVIGSGACLLVLGVLNLCGVLPGVVWIGVVAVVLVAVHVIPLVLELIVTESEPNEFGLDHLLMAAGVVSVLSAGLLSLIGAKTYRRWWLARRRTRRANR